jgi:hypothetical protein
MYKSILVENQQIRHLLSLIKSYYKSECKEDTLREVNLIHIANNVSDTIIRNHIVECWDNLQTKVGHEITLLENNCDRSIINKLYRKTKSICFVIKTRPDHTSDELHKSIKKSSNIDVVIKEFKI